MAIYLNGCISSKMTVTAMIIIIRMNTHRRVVSHQTCAHNGAVDKPYPIFKLRDKIEEKTGWEGYADTDRR